MQLLNVGHRAIQLPLLVVAFGGAGSIRLTLLLILFGVSVVKGHLIGQDVLVSDGELLLGRPGIFHGKLTDQGQVPESLLEEHDDGFIIDFRDDVPLVAKMLDEFLEGLSLLLYNASQVPIDPWSLTSGPKFVDELLAQVRPQTDQSCGEPHEPCPS
jgi:hypothetical protein